jgi:hypothetical protein
VTTWSVENVLILSGAVIAPVIWHFILIHQRRKALQWWFKQQSFKLWNESERIRNDILQEVFVIRRYFESHLHKDASPDQEFQDCLERFEKLQKSLGILNHQLCPDYGDESLPLAIQSLTKRWQSASPNLHLTLDLPTQWQPTSLAQNRLILTTLDELLKIVSPATLTHPQLSIRLAANTHGGTVEVRLQNINLEEKSRIIHSSELIYVYRAFQWLMLGQSSVQAERKALIWRFRWQFDVNGKL